MKRIYYILTILLFTLLSVTACIQVGDSSNNSTIGETIQSNYLNDKEFAVETFNANQEVFSGLQNYYVDLDYKEKLQELEYNQLIEIDGVEYDVLIDENEYVLSYYDMAKQKGYENLPDSVSTIRGFFDNYKGFVISINKESFEAVDIQINISNDIEGYSLWIIWGKNQENIKDCNIPLNDNWGIYSMYYSGI